jgi:hypothetical protein
MNGTAVYAYAQARLQARQGMRPDESTWRTLERSTNLAHLLRNARNSVLREWILAFPASIDAHRVELDLRHQYRQLVILVAGWLPRRWRPAVAWTRIFIALPALEHLLKGETALAWMLEDPDLRPVAVMTPDARTRTQERSVYQPLLIAREGGEPLLRAWIRMWRGLWPTDSDAVLRHLNHLVHIIGASFRTLSEAPPATDSVAVLGSLEASLELQFHRHSHQPATAVSYLALTALDLLRLRGLLLRHILFDAARES